MLPFPPNVPTLTKAIATYIMLPKLNMSDAAVANVIMKEKKGSRKINTDENDNKEEARIKEKENTDFPSREKRKTRRCSVSVNFQIMHSKKKDFMQNRLSRVYSIA